MLRFMVKNSDYKEFLLTLYLANYNVTITSYLYALIIVKAANTHILIEIIWGRPSNYVWQIPPFITLEIRVTILRVDGLMVDYFNLR